MKVSSAEKGSVLKRSGDLGIKNRQPDVNTILKLISEACQR